MDEQKESFEQTQLEGTPRRTADWFHLATLASKQLADTYAILTIVTGLPDQRLEPGDRETLLRARVVFNRLVQMQLGVVAWDLELDDAFDRIEKVGEKAIKATERALQQRGES